MKSLDILISTENDDKDTSNDTKKRSQTEKETTKTRDDFPLERNLTPFKGQQNTRYDTEVHTPYALEHLHSQRAAVNYEKLWGHMGNARESRAYTDNIAAKEGKPQKVGQYTHEFREKEAQSVVERVLQIRQFGDTTKIHYKEIERFKHWRRFAHNRVLQKAWERDSVFGYKSPGPKMVRT